MIYEFEINAKYRIHAKSLKEAELKFYQTHNCKQEFLDKMELKEIITKTNEEEE